MEKRFKKLLNLDPDIQPGDETTMANNPRNWVADKVNPLIEEYINPVLPKELEFTIPKMTVAEEKQYKADLPEMMAGATMGSVKPTGRFNKLMPEQNYGKVTVIPSAADKLADAQKAQMARNTAARRYQKEFVDSGLAQKQKETLSPDEFRAWNLDVINKLLRGE